MLFVVSAIYGAPLAAMLPSGGYDVANSESAQAQRILNGTFGAGGMPLVFEITGPNGPDTPAVRARAGTVLDALHRSPYATQITSFWTSSPRSAASLLSDDRRTGLVVAEIIGSDSEAPPRAHAIARSLTAVRDNVTVRAGGQAIAYYDVNRQSRVDLITVEVIAVPFTFIVLVWIFGSAVAAILPIAVAFFAVAGTTAALRMIFALTDVSVFALNLATALCLALAIDYTLLIIERYREEVAGGVPRSQAVVATMNTAGRTVLYSAITVGLSLATMVVFPVYFLRSLAYAGVIGVALCLLGALVVAPALLVILGGRIDRWNIRAPIGRLFGRKPTVRRMPQEAFFYRTALVAMRHAVPAVMVVAALFLTLGLPFLALKVAYPDDRVLPTTAPARQAGDVLRKQFPQLGANAIRIVMPSGADSAGPIAAYAAQLSRSADVIAVAAPDGTYVRGTRIDSDAHGAGINGDAAYLTVSSSQDPYSASARSQLAALKRISAPAHTLFGGAAQQNIDDVHGITSRIPLVLLLVAAITLILVFLFTGSIVLPVKALVLNTLSLTAAFGAMVWIFQQGHLAGFGTTVTGTINAALPPMIFCVAFGLSMDYEVFVLSRIREEWLRTRQSSGADNERAIALGLARTGGIVTAAATVMAIVFVAMIASKMANMRMLGTGLSITVLMDAFVVRTVLVPAAMRVMGRANWWAPAPLTSWHTKRALRHKDLSPAPTAAAAPGSTGRYGSPIRGRVQRARRSGNTA